MIASSGHPLVFAPPLVLALVIALLFAAGCEREAGETKDKSGDSSVAGAAPEHYLDTKRPATPILATTVPAAPKPTASLPKGASCVTPECHASYLKAAHIHGPVGEKACGSCHEDDIGGHKYPLKRGGKNETCTFCHAVAGTMMHQHKPIADSPGGCITCHEPHVAASKFLLKADNVEQLCLKCHTVPLKKFAHEPFAKGQCTLCHEPHQSANAKLLRGGEGKDHCLSCHAPMKQTLASATSVHKPVQQACTTCHNPHSSDFAHELKAPVQETCLASGCHDKVKEHMSDASVKHKAMSTDASCAACHNPHASAQQHLLADRTDKLCGQCHTEMKKTLASSQFLHGPVRVGNCSACHDPHGGANADLLDRSFPQTFYTRFDVKKYDLCFNCHESSMVLTKTTATLTNFRNGETNLHFVHVNRDEKGRSCKTCHDVHGSNLPNHMASAVPFEGSKWSMPMEYQKTETGGSCTPGCHAKRTYVRTGPATAPAPTTRGAS